VDGVDFVAVKQNTLRKGGFPRIDMRADSDIPHPGYVDAHFVLHSYIKRRYRRCHPTGQ
jgi:hypothetical protein